MPWSSSATPWMMRISVMSNAHFSVRSLPKGTDEARQAHGDALAISTTTYEGRAPGEDRDEAFLRFFAGCLSFLEQRITTSEQRPANRGLRRQLAREQYPIFRQVPDVRVIELHRREHQRDDGQDDRRGDGPEWGYQWIVSGHWQQLRRVPDSVMPPSVGFTSGARAPCASRRWAGVPESERSRKTIPR